MKIMTEQFEIGLYKVSLSWSADKTIINRIIQLQNTWATAWEKKATYGQFMNEEKMKQMDDFQKFIEQELNRLTEIMVARGKGNK